MFSLNCETTWEYRVCEGTVTCNEAVTTCLDKAVELVRDESLI
jgi:hypothetical protein